MSKRDHVDVIVVGLGAMGAAVAWHAARLGLSVRGFDRHRPPHSLGSTHAETRITRLAVAEGPQYLPFAQRSHELWRELHAATGEQVLFESGGFTVNTTERDPARRADENRWADFVLLTEDVARDASIPVTRHSAAEVRAAVPRVLMRDDEHAVHERGAGVVLCERAVALQLDEARRAGADLHFDEAVMSFQATDDGVTVRTPTGDCHAERLVLASGPWLPELVGEHDRSDLTVTRQVVYWFEVDDLDDFEWSRFPFFIWAGMTATDYLGIFPVIKGSTTPALKVLSEQFTSTTSPSAVNRSVSEAEVDDMYERLVSTHLTGVRPTCLRAAVCLYTNTPDDHFLIDTDPRSERVTIMSPCSGHGFKHSAALGEAVAQMIAHGRSDLHLAPFGRRERPRPTETH